MSSSAIAQTQADAKPRPAARPAHASQAQVGAPEDIVVTSTRRATSLARVPMSVAAYSQKKMDDQGVRSIADIARLTPDVQFNTTTGVTSGQASGISIRGIASAVGAATTGIYIDDTPIQVRTVLNTAGTSYPQVFDLDRVEVLRGPQGTLFGAGAEGGALRFITPQPDLHKFSGYGRTDISTTEHGDPSWEVGYALGGPIVPGKLGLRVSAWTRSTGGYIDQVSPFDGHVVNKNVNSNDAAVYRAALTWTPTDRLTITPSYYYQNIFYNGRDQYWENVSNPSAGRFNTANLVGQPSRDQFGLAALRIAYRFDGFDVINNGSLFDRAYKSTYDYTNFNAALFNGSAFNYGAASASPSYNGLKQHNWTEEFRLQSNRPHQFVDWSFGAFASWDRETASQYSENPTLGLPLADGLYEFTSNILAYDKQVAGFGNLDFNITRRLKLTVGGRYSATTFTSTSVAGGPLGGTAAPVTRTQTQSPFTPKFGVSYQVTPHDFVYFSAAKGFRIGGVNGDVLATCRSDLAQLGLSAAPSTYKSDTLWSYELGAKDSLFGGRLQLDSSIYRINWSNIQQRIYLSDCGASFIGNLGSTTTNGGDISATAQLTEDLQLGVALGYFDTTYDKTVNGGGNAILAVKGARIGGSPLVLTISPVYRFSIWNHHDAFVRADYTFRSRGPSVDAQVYGYNAAIPGLPATNYPQLRAGLQLKRWEITVYADNVTNESAGLYRSSDTTASTLYYNTTYRPLTTGLTVVSRF